MEYAFYFALISSAAVAVFMAKSLTLAATTAYTLP